MSVERRASDRAQRPPYGLRGWLLLTFGSIWAVWGGTLLLIPGDRDTAPLYTFVTMLAPVRDWGALWLATGLAAAIAGLIRRHGAGFVALILMPLGWGLGLAAAGIFAGSPSGIPLGYTFVGLSLVVTITSRMRDARPVEQRPAPGVEAGDQGPT